MPCSHDSARAATGSATSPSPRCPSARCLAVVLCCLALAPSALAGTESPERPPLPGWSLAGDDGPASIWSNPAHLAFDPNPAWALYYDQEQITDGTMPAGMALVTNGGPLGTGIAYHSQSDGPSWWTLSTGLGLKLDRDLAMGVGFGWQIPNGTGNNFVTWDLGGSWRPTSWFGLAAIARNIGNPSPALGVESAYGAGVVFRPFGDTLRLGLDWLTTGPHGSHPRGQGAASLALCPARGILIRLSGDQAGEVGAGVDISFGRLGTGAFAEAAVDGTNGPLGIAWVHSASPADKVQAGGKRVVEFDLDDSYPYHSASGLFSRPSETYFHLLKRLRLAAEDKSVHGIVIELDQVPFSFAQIEELRGEIARARDRGKPVIAYLDRATSNKAYLLATAADRIYLHPAGELDLVGLSIELHFMRGTLDLIGVQPQFVRRAEYKSAPEAQTNTEASPANREEINALLDDLSKHLIQGIAEGRKLDEATVQELIDKGPFTAREAVDQGLVDDLAYPDELKDKASDLLPDEPQIDDAYMLTDRVDPWQSNRRIAVVSVTGLIVSGKSSAPGLFGGEWTAGSDTIVAELDQARKRDSVKAVVMRVDSPGGSAFASDEIWRAVKRVRDAGKPVIVSMGGLAASGAYYVSSGATAIYAEPSTITGSIGVYAGKVSLARLYDKIGLNVEEFNRGRNANMWSISRPFDPEQYAALDRMVGQTYSLFKQRVSEGRDLPLDKVDEIARGRVWSGEAAKHRGLVDEFGGFSDAVARAKKEAGIPDNAQVSLVTFHGQPRPDGQLTEQPMRWGRRVLFPVAGGSPTLPPALSLVSRWHALSGETTWMVLPYRVEPR